MNADYLLLCGVMWAQYASADACRELIRALHSKDQDVVLLACALLENAMRAPSRQSPREFRRLERDISYTPRLV